MSTESTGTFRHAQDMVLTDTEALAARRDLADRLKQREYQMAVDADMEVGCDSQKDQDTQITRCFYWFILSNNQHKMIQHWVCKPNLV